MSLGTQAGLCLCICVGRWQLNFTQDPSRPRLYELLTPEEVELFSNIRVGHQPLSCLITWAGLCMRAHGSLLVPHATMWRPLVLCPH